MLSCYVDHMRILVIACISAALALGCSSKGDDGKNKSKGKTAGNQGSTAKKPGTAKVPPKTRKRGLGCDVVRRTNTEGSADVEYLAGKDKMSMEVEDNKVKLRTGTVMTGGATLRVLMRASYVETEIQQRMICVAFTRIMFTYDGKKRPELDKPIAYKFTGDLTKMRHNRATVFYVDINEKKSLASMGPPTIEYIGTEGTFKFVSLNQPADKRKKHTVSFAIVFNKVTDGKIDDSVKTKLSGEITFDTSRDL